METVMNGFEKHAVYYRAYLADDRSLVPLTIVLVTGIAFWLLVYLISAVGPAPSTQPSAIRTPPAVTHVTASEKPTRP